MNGIKPNKDVSLHGKRRKKKVYVFIKPDLRGPSNISLVCNLWMFDENTKEYVNMRGRNVFSCGRWRNYPKSPIYCYTAHVHYVPPQTVPRPLLSPSDVWNSADKPMTHNVGEHLHLLTLCVILMYDDTLFLFIELRERTFAIMALARSVGGCPPPPFFLS